MDEVMTVKEVMKMLLKERQRSKDLEVLIMELARQAQEAGVPALAARAVAALQPARGAPWWGVDCRWAGAGRHGAGDDWA